MCVDVAIPQISSITKNGAGIGSDFLVLRIDQIVKHSFLRAVADVVYGPYPSHLVGRLRDSVTPAEAAIREMRHCSGYAASRSIRFLLLFAFFVKI